ncbi:MAG: PAS domain S-box protein [Planctomycetes bacterium]|nr:PAS domain S-box protein [Planctomycetota bacterium]
MTLPAWHTDGARSILILRLVLTLAVAGASLSGLPSLWPGAGILAIYAVVNVLLLLDIPAKLARRIPKAFLFVLDLAVIVTMMVLAGETRSQFYVTFFLIILMAALARSAMAAWAIAAASACLYGLLVGIAHPAELLDVAFSTRIALFFVTALFAGHMAEQTHVERREHQRYRSFYQTLFEKISIGLMVADQADRIRDANALAVELLGFDPRGRPVSSLLHLSASQLDRALKPADTPTPAAAPGSFCITVVRPDGSTVPCEVTIKPFPTEDEPCSFIIIRDIRSERMMQERMTQLEKISVLGQLMSSLTHELNNPLTVVLGCSELLQAERLPSEVREYATHINDAGRRCKRVIDGFLNQYRLRPFSPALTKLADVLRGAVRLVDFHLRYHLVKLQQEIDDEAAALVDPQQMEQLLVNLMINAVQAMQNRSTRMLRLRVRREADGCAVDVSDTGSGIPPDVRRRLFEPGISAKPDGHGLGLSLSNEIAARHGGRITVETSAEGTTYTVHLPTVLGASQPAPRK